MSDLREQLIRLAYENPEIRDEILPLLKQAGCEKLPDALREQCEKKVEEGKKNDKKAYDEEELDGLTRLTARSLKGSLDKAMKHLADAMGYYNQIKKDPSVPAQDTADAILREWKMACSRLVKDNPFMTAAMFLKKASQYADRLEKW